MIKNKKGTVFGVFLVIGMIAILTTVWYSFDSAKTKMLIEMDSPTYIYQLNSIKENFIAYNKESAKMSSQQAFYDILTKDSLFFPETCEAYQGNIILTDSCLPDKEKITALFIQKFNENYQNFIKNYPIVYLRQEKTIEQGYSFSPRFETQINGNLLTLNYAEQEINLTRKGNLLNYTYYVQMPAEIKLNLENSGIYLNSLSDDLLLLKNKAEECKTNQEINKIRACMNSLNLKNLNSDSSINGGYLILSTETKENFFYNELGMEKYGKIKVNFAVKLV